MVAIGALILRSDRSAGSIEAFERRPLPPGHKSRLWGALYV